MSKKNALIFGSLFLILVFASAGGYILFAKKDTPKRSDDSLLLTKPNSSPEAASLMADQTYTDEAGFSFGYSNDLTPKDTTPTDPEYYSQVTLSKGSSSLVISVLDSSYKTTADWANSMSAAKPTLTGSTTLGKIEADQYIYGTDFVTIAIDKGVLYLIKAPNDAYWEEVQNMITSSFVFEGQTAQSSGQTGAIDTVYEEEVVE